MRVTVDVTAIPERPAGAGVYVLRLVEALDAADVVDLTLVARRGDGARWLAAAPTATVRAIAPGPRPARLVWEQVAGPFAARGADVWHGPHYTMPRLARPPKVVTIHDLTFFDHPQWHEPSKVRFFRRMIRNSVRHADALVCVSDRTAARLRELLDPQVPVIVASLGVDHDRYQPTGPDAALDLPDRFVAFVGTIEPRKNVPALVRAVARLDPSVHLVLAGQDGWGSAEVEATIAATGMRDRVVRLGYVTDDVVPALYRQAVAVAYPAFREGFGLPALEALACGAALVTTTGSPMEDVVRDAALLVAPGDDDALLDALARLVAGGPEIDELRRRGPIIAAGHTWARSAERHLEAYRLACGR
jgi:glycosyltransferase involved in cell wall biosynthesis